MLLQKIINIFLYALCVVCLFYVLLMVGWLLLPLLLVAVLIGAWRIFQARRMWNELIKQQAKTHKKRIHIASDDTIIDAEYEEIKTP